MLIPKDDKSIGQGYNITLGYILVFVYSFGKPSGAKKV